MTRSGRKATTSASRFTFGRTNENGNSNGKTETISLKQAIANWQECSMALRESMNSLFEVLEQQADHFRGGTKMVQDQFPDAVKLIGASSEKGP